MKKETKDTWIFYSSLAIVCTFTALAIMAWGIVWVWRLIKKLFKGI